MEKTIFSILMQACAIGTTWIFAGAFNPDIDSGTVWFVAFILGGIWSSFGRLLMYATGEWR